MSVPLSSFFIVSFAQVKESTGKIRLLLTEAKETMKKELKGTLIKETSKQMKVKLVAIEDVLREKIRESQSIVKQTMAKDNSEEMKLLRERLAVLTSEVKEAEEDQVGLEQVAEKVLTDLSQVEKSLTRAQEERDTTSKNLNVIVDMLGQVEADFEKKQVDAANLMGRIEAVLGETSSVNEKVSREVLEREAAVE